MSVLNVKILFKNRFSLSLFFVLAGLLLISAAYGQSTPSCTDDIQNGDEIGVDCGGSCPNACMCDEVVFSDNAEEGILQDRWIVYVGNPNYSENKPHNGNGGIYLDSRLPNDVDNHGEYSTNIGREFPDITIGRATLFFYETMDTNIRQTILAGGKDGISAVGLEADTNVDTNNYIITRGRITGGSDRYSTTFSRTEGWHNATMIITENLREFYIDNTKVYSIAVSGPINKIWTGVFGNDPNEGFVDDVVVISFVSCPTCTDGIQNGDETDIDCGGSCANQCACSNGVQDDNEEGIDCGGSCSNDCTTCFPGIEWERTYGGSSMDSGQSVTQTSDGGYAVIGVTTTYGSGSRDVYLVKTDSEGNQTWQKTFGGQDNDQGNDIVETDDGGLLISAVTDSFSTGYSDNYIIKTNSSGEQEWNLTFGNSQGGDGAYRIEFAPDGKYVFAGAAGPTYYVDHHIFQTDNLGHLEWSRIWGTSSTDTLIDIKRTSDGGYIATGNIHAYPSTADIYVVKTNSSGSIEWEGEYGGLSDDQGRSIVVDSDGYVVAGFTSSKGNGGKDVYVFKINNTGDIIWEFTFGGAGEDYGSGIVKAVDGGFVISATTNSYGNGGHDILLIKLNSEGFLRWYKTIGGVNGDWVSDAMASTIKRTADSGYIVAGGTNSYGNGGTDVYLIKINPELPGCIELSDSDNDGYNDDVDCAPFDPAINPDAIELCNNIDDNCNGLIDEELSMDCGEGVCSGQKTCTAGVWSDCSTYNTDAGICALCDGEGIITYDGTQDIDCARNNLPEIGTCTNTPDNNAFTWDYAAGFTSVCSGIETCTTGEYSYTHTCSKNQCNAQCETDTDCSTTECDNLDACYAGTYRDYQDASNICQETCACTQNTCNDFREIVTDTDADGYDIECEADCNDNDPAVYPGAKEICDNKDNDCNGLIDDIDADNDGINDCTKDLCLGTSIPETTVPEKELGTNRFALTNGDTVFDTKLPNGKGPQKTFTLQDTKGCSCEQILGAYTDEMNGHWKYGCSISVMEDWINKI